MFGLVERLKTDREVEGGSDGKLFQWGRNVKSGRIIWKGSLIKIIIGIVMWKEMQYKVL